MSRVKIEDLKPPAKDLDVKEMKKLYGGSILADKDCPHGHTPAHDSTITLNQ